MTAGNEWVRPVSDEIATSNEPVAFIQGKGCIGDSKLSTPASHGETQRKSSDFFDSVLAALSEEQMILFTLRTCGFTTKEIACHLGISQATVSRRFLRLRDALKAEFGT